MVPQPAFVSDQVSEARRYYLDLNPDPSESLRVVCGGVERMQADYVVSRKRFPFYAIELVTEGEGSLRLDEGTFSLSHGSLFAYGPQTRHQIRNQPPSTMRKYYIDLAGHDAESLLKRAGLLAAQPLRVGRVGELVEVFEAIDREARGDSELTTQVCEQWLRLLLVKIEQCSLAGHPSAEPRAYATYEIVKRHVEEHFLRLSTVQAVAEECDLTAIHVSRLFRRFGATGAYQFLMRQKMNYAAALLVEEGLLVREVAEQLGFSDPFQFSRAFKRVYGIPPKQLIASQQRSSE